MAALIVTVLKAAVKVKKLAADGKTQLLEPSGAFDEHGKPVLRGATRVMHVKQGQPVPEHAAKGEVERLKKAGVVGKPGEEAKATSQQAPKGEPAKVALDLEKLADYDASELAGLWAKKPPTVAAVLEAVGTDGDLAEKALAAENTATKGDGRATLVPALQKVIEEATATS